MAKMAKWRPASSCLQVRLIPPSSSAVNGGFKPLPLRQVKAEQIGALVRVSGIVTRVSDVKPLVEVAT